MKKINRLKNLKFPSWTVPIILLFITIISFGLLIPYLGFYWDDWAKSLVHRLYGIEGYWSYYAYDRPLSAWTHILLFPILGEVPINWQIFTLSMRWLSAVTMWWSLSLLWPNARRQITYAALLFLIYPSFAQQPISVTFHQQWMQYVLFFISVGLMILAVKNKKLFWLYTIGAVLALILEITITEYFIPLELLRPFMLWYLINRSTQKLSQRVTNVIKQWAPYLMVVIIYIVWRQFFMHLVEEDPYQMKLLTDLMLQPIGTIIHLAKVVFLDSLNMLIACWSPVLNLGVNLDIPKVIWLAWLAAVVTILVVVIYLRNITFDENANPTVQNNWIVQASIIGFFTIILGTLPAWLIGRSAIDDFHANRYTLPAMWGISLLFICVIDSLVKRGFYQNVVLSVLIAVAVTFHIRTADEFRQIWEKQVSFYWQLHWRAPYLEPGTALMLEEEPFPNQGLFSTSSAINFLYPQPKNQPHLAYWVYTLRPRYNSFIPAPLKISFSSSFRSLSFTGATPNSILIYYDPGRANCLWVLDPYRDQDDPNLTDLTMSFLPISNLEQIKSGPTEDNYPPQELIGSEPKGEWCYFYQSAELARQYNDWANVIDIAERASDEGYAPDQPGSKTPHEWLVFIEGYAYMGNWDKALALIKEVKEISYGQYDAKLCSLWNHIAQNTSNSQQKERVSLEIIKLLQCEP